MRPVAKRMPFVPVFYSGTPTVLRPLRRAFVPRIPWNFMAEGKTDGILLTWEPVSGADGYEILRSDTGNFSNSIETTDNVLTIALSSGQQDSYFDALGATSVTRYYMIRATAGTISSPHSVKGPLSGKISQTSGSGTTTSDTTTTDESQVAIDDGVATEGTTEGARGRGILPRD